MTLQINGPPVVAVKAGEADRDVEGAFRHLLNWWRRDTEFVSSAAQLFGHPAYRAIVAMGWPVVPHLLTELRREPGQWVSALREITGVSAVTTSGRTPFNELVQAWLRWGRENGVE